MDLVEFLRARLRDDENAIEGEIGAPLYRPYEQLLADVEAKRRIVELHEGDHECSTYDHNGEVDHCTWVIGNCSTLQLLALPYASHDDYQPEWKL